MPPFAGPSTGPARQLRESRMKARIKWVENVAFMAESESGHVFVMDGAPEGGGRNLGPRPMEVVLMGTGACTAYDVVTILRKARQSVSDCQVQIEAERAADDPKVFTHSHAFRGHRTRRKARAGGARNRPVG